MAFLLDQKRFDAFEIISTDIETNRQDWSQGAATRRAVTWRAVYTAIAPAAIAPAAIAPAAIAPAAIAPAAIACTYQIRNYQNS
ncbi:MAG: hypothetical protein ACLQCB_18545 [Spirochaetia bacterium]